MNTTAFPYKTAALQMIADAIEAGGATSADEYDIEAIFDDCFSEFDSTWQSGEGAFHLTATDDEFWASVQRHEI
jgi:hypothetical protein